MPIYVAVQEPRARIVSEETDRHIIPCISHAHDVADDGVVIVVSRTPSTANYMEVVPMQVNRMLYRWYSQDTHDHSANTCTAHRSTKSKGACRNADLDALLAPEIVDGPFWEKVRRLYTVQDLKQYRNVR